MLIYLLENLFFLPSPAPVSSEDGGKKDAGESADTKIAEECFR